jgi:hypothetical protein
MSSLPSSLKKILLVDIIILAITNVENNGVSLSRVKKSTPYRFNSLGYSKNYKNGVLILELELGNG